MSTASIIINIVLAGVAFGAARNWENGLSRVLGIGFLIARGGMLVAAGTVGDQGPLPTLVGAAMLVLAGVAWWQGKS
jgi:hypothetical protein